MELDNNMWSALSRKSKSEIIAGKVQVARIFCPNKNLTHNLQTKFQIEKTVK
jgi:hypothetical protein